MRALRIDDLGASSKQYEQWSRTRWANVGPFKTLTPWRAWGPYGEMGGTELYEVFNLVHVSLSRVTLAITACWVEDDGSLTPYQEKFPLQACVVKEWAQRGVVEVANHGLTHCREGRHLPRFWRGNRPEHREFTLDLTERQIVGRVLRAQALFTDWLGHHAPRILVPPGFHFPEGVTIPGMRIWRKDEDRNVLAMHDRDFVLGDGFARLAEALAHERLVACWDLP